MNQYPLHVTIDTCVFDSLKYNFNDDSSLGLLKKYVADGRIKVYMSDVVIREMMAHVTRNCNDIFQYYEKLKKESGKIFSSDCFKAWGFGFLVFDYDGEEIKRSSLKMLDDYIQSIAEEILTLSSVNVNAIFDDYFNIRPPFEDKKTKRSEFPDAFIIQELKNRFCDDGEPVFVISRDAGFVKAFEGVERFQTMEDLNALFDFINKNDEEKEVEYKRTASIYESLKETIAESVRSYVLDNECIEVYGQTKDSDGNVYGSEDEEISLYSIDKLRLVLHSVDDITEIKSFVTVLAEADMIVDRSYADYVFDRYGFEGEECLYVDTVVIREQHRARFAIHVVIDRVEESFVIHPFKIVLNGDTRVNTEKRHFR